MTLTLQGRWQTRIVLYLTVGVLVTLFFGRIYGDFSTHFALLAYLLGLGLVWDVIYQRLERRRWNRDWPPYYQVFTGLLEGALLFWLIKWSQANGLPSAQGLPGISPDLGDGAFIIHYFCLWLGVFLGTQGPLRVIFPRWRYRGGRWF
jgi:hypothetical protein